MERVAKVPGGIILVIDDDEDLRHTIAEVLGDAGYTVALAENGLAALAWISKSRSPPALALVDLMMPIMDGLQFRAEVRGRAELSALPLVFLSAGQRERYLPLVAPDPVVSKPLRIDELLEVVAAALHSS